MNPEQALDVLVQASKMASMTYDNHVLCQKASEVLNNFIKQNGTVFDESKTKPSEVVDLDS